MHTIPEFIALDLWRGVWGEDGRQWVAQKE